MQRTKIREPQISLMSLRAPKGGLGGQKRFRLQWEKDVTHNSSVPRYIERKCIEWGRNTTESVSEWWWEGGRRNASTNTDEESSNYRKERKMFGRVQDWPALSQRRKWSPLSKQWPWYLSVLLSWNGTWNIHAVSSPPPPPPFAGVWLQTVITCSSAEACCSSVRGLFFQGKDDGENQVPPSPLVMEMPSAFPKKKR